MFDDLAAKFVKDVRAIRRKDDKFETEKVVWVVSCKEQKSIEDCAYLPNKTANFSVADGMHGFSLRGRELERGVGQNNNYSMPIFEVGTNVVAEGYVRKNIIPMFEVGTNVVTEGYVRKNIIPMFEVGANVVTEGYVRST